MAFRVWLGRCRFVLASVVVSGAIFFLGNVQDADARSRMVSLVVDGNTGRVLYSRGANVQRYPASLTKIMTLYVMFEEMQKRRINNHTWIRFSRRAAAQPPSKLGLRPGQRIRAIHAIKMLVTKSANDVAVAVAEHISGTEYKFAKRMTRTARKLGMSRTVFRNASGLPNSSQITTAKDMVTLSRAIQRDFPQYFKYFKTRSFTYNGRKYRNHNRLLGRYRGMEGIKTGYTRAAGFNLTTSVKYNNRHIVAAVLGGKTSRKRDSYMRYVLDRSLPRAVALSPAAIRAKKQRLAFAKKENNSDRHVIRLLRRDEQTMLQDYTLRDRIAAIINKPVVLGSSVRRVAEITDTVRAATEQGSREPATGSVRIAAVKTPAVKKTIAKSPPVAANTSPWNIQVGAFALKTQALDRLETVRRAATRILIGSSEFVQEVNSDGKTFYRARFGLKKKRTASIACKNLKRKNIACFVLKN